MSAPFPDNGRRAHSKSCFINRRSIYRLSKKSNVIRTPCFYEFRGFFLLDVFGLEVNNVESDSDLIENKTKSSLVKIYPWVVWFLGSCFFFYKYLVQVSPSVMTKDLMHTFQINGAGLGNLSACYFYAYLLMQIPVGLLLDKYSPRFLTTAAILICAISTYVFSATDSLFLACLSRGFIGFGAAFAAVSCFKSASLWFPPKRFAYVSGMCMTAAMMGAVGGQMPLSILVEDYGWRFALKIVAFIGIILGALYIVLIRDKQTTNLVVPKKTHNINPLQILKSSQAWVLSLYSGLAFAPVSVFGGLWGVPFLQKAYNFSASQSAMAVSCIFIGFAIGAPLLGYLSDLMGRRKPLMQFGTLLALVSLIFVIYGGQISIGMAELFLFLFGFGASGFFISFAMIREVFPLILTATVLGFMNTFDSICEAISEPIVGMFLDFTWNGKVIDGIHQFSVLGYKKALLILPLYLIVALVILSFIKETYCQAER